MNTIRIAGLFFVAGSLLAGAAHADDPKYTFTKQDDVKDVKGVEWDATAEAGLVLTTGNSETTTATGGAKLSRKTGKNKFAASIDGTYAKSGIRKAREGVTQVASASDIVEQSTVTAKNVTAKARYDRYLTTLNSLFVGVVGQVDEPAGKKFAGSAQLGYSRSLLKNEKHEAVAELGLDVTHTRFVSGDPSTITVPSARAFLAYKGKMTESTNLDTSVEVLPNLNKYDMPTGPVAIGEDTRVNFHVGYTSKITKNLSVNTSFDAKYDNRPAPLALPGVTFAADFVPEAAKTDTTLKASLIYSFF